jgi:hypothetical protein
MKIKFFSGNRIQEITIKGNRDVLIEIRGNKKQYYKIKPTGIIRKAKKQEYHQIIELLQQQPETQQS